MVFVLEEDEVIQPQKGRFVLEDDEPKPESMFQAAGRHITRSGARIAETFAGLPGDIGALAGFGTQKALETMLPEGKTPATPEQKEKGDIERQKIEQFRTMMQERGLGEDDLLPERLPSAHELKQFTNDITGGYTEAKGRGEEFADEVVADTASLFMGRGTAKAGGILYKTFRTVGKPFLVSLGANIAKEGVDTFGGGDKAQTYTKIGSMALLDLIGKKSASSLGKELYKTAEDNLPKNAIVSSKNFLPRLNKLEQELSRGGKAASTTPILEKIGEIKDKISKSGNIEVRELEAFKRNINEASEGLYTEILDKDIKRKLRRNYDSLRKEVKSGIADYGKNNPKFYEPWKQAEEVHGAIAQSNKIRKNTSKFLEKHSKIAVPGIGSAALFGLYHNPAGALVSIPAVGAVYSWELANRVMRSPTLRMHYLKSIKAALNDNKVEFMKNFTALDNEIKNEKD